MSSPRFYLKLTPPLLIGVADVEGHPVLQRLKIKNGG